MKATLRVAAILMASWMGTSPAAAAVYPCPSDPGFCYRDFGDDGCFDAGTDDGPIDAEIEGSSSFPAVPDPGSIVCPPSVEQLVATNDDIRLETPAGSSILFYAAKVNARDFETISGSRLLVGGLIEGLRSSTHIAEGDIDIEAGAKLLNFFSPNRSFELDTSTGSITVGAKAKILAGSEAAFRAPAGDVTFGEGVKVRLRDGTQSHLVVEAGGDVVMTKPRFDVKGQKAGALSSAAFDIVGANVTILERSRIKTKGVFHPLHVNIEATAGDVAIDHLFLVTTAPVTITGTNVTIGIDQNGKVSPSNVRVTGGPRRIDVLASDAIALKLLRLTATDDVTIETTGTSVELLSSVIQGKGATPTIEVAGGVGSVCDLTGTIVKNANLVTSCDTVIGP